MRYIDSHAHIMSEEFQDDFEEVIRRINNHNITKVMIVTTRPEEALKAVDFVRRNPSRFQCAYGIHPEDIETASAEALTTVEKIGALSEVAAIGEIGLDYHWHPELKPQQRELFIRQIEIAEKLGKPIIVHSRSAAMDTVDILKDHPVRGVLHCFSGSAETARDLVKRGYYIGLGGMVTFKNAKTAKEVAASVDINYLLSETDCPYMAPEPVRGTRNEPANIPYIVKYIAGLRNMPEEELCEIIYANYERFLEA